MADRVMTLRLPADMGRDAEFIARTEETSLSEFLRDAIAAAIKLRFADPEFRRRGADRLKADSAILDRLSTLADP